MKLILASFGVTQQPEVLSKEMSLFYRMPPVSIRFLRNTFMPDYAALLLCEKIILDESSFAVMQEKPHWSYTAVSEVLKSLYDEGFVELVDFNRILENNQVLLQRMLEYDLKILDQWIAPLKESLHIWDGFMSGFWHDFNGLAMHVVEVVDGQVSGTAWLVNEALESSRKRRKVEYRDALRETLSLYLSYVNANIVLSNELGTGFHDWADYLPFYRQKFLPVGREDLETQQHIETSQNLFEISFPEFAITDNATFMKVLSDKRVADLRRLVQDAVEGKLTFDEEFAWSVFKEVLGVERRAAKYRNIISYLTMPLDFLPWVGIFVQKAAEETVGMLVDRKLKQKHRWFYLLSDVVGGPSKSERSYWN